jgi:hypothetical protein
MRPEDAGRIWTMYPFASDPRFRTLSGGNDETYSAVTLAHASTSSRGRPAQSVS